MAHGPVPLRPAAPAGRSVRAEEAPEDGVHLHRLLLAICSYMRMMMPTMSSTPVRSMTDGSTMSAKAASAPRTRPIAP